MRKSPLMIDNLLKTEPDIVCRKTGHTERINQSHAVKKQTQAITTLRNILMTIDL